jgi:hypothetical protein
MHRVRDDLSSHCHHHAMSFASSHLIDGIARRYADDRKSRHGLSEGRCRGRWLREVVGELEQGATQPIAALSPDPT